MVPTGAGIFSPHVLQRMMKSHCPLSGILNTDASVGEQKANINREVCGLLSAFLEATD
jgi:hypothetical protein